MKFINKTLVAVLSASLLVSSVSATMSVEEILQAAGCDTALKQVKLEKQKTFNKRIFWSLAALTTGCAAYALDNYKFDGAGRKAIANGLSTGYNFAKDNKVANYVGDKAVKGYNLAKDNKVTNYVVDKAVKGYNLAKDNKVTNWVSTKVASGYSNGVKHAKTVAGYFASFFKKAPVELVEVTK